MNYILQKDAEKKEARKHKKAAQTAAAAAKHNCAEDTATDAVAASALRAFGGVVDLCTQLGCRRARLLNHFGEDLHSSQHHHVASKTPVGRLAGSTGQPPFSAAAALFTKKRCCDYCDNPSILAASVQQLKDKETELLQRRFSKAGYSNKRQKKEDGDVLADMWDAAASDSDEAQLGELESLSRWVCLYMQLNANCLTCGFHGR